MARSSQTILGYVNSWLMGAKLSPSSDGEILRRFVQRRDEAAFGELLDRHGPMILGLCRRLIGDSHLSEDVFQATFLVLARKGKSIRRPDSLGAWLYGVAYRLALKARAKLRRQEPQPLPERPASGPDPLEDISARELLEIIDGEVQRLPETYRLPLIHCCLEGRSLEETAQALGWTTGSVKGRLERGRVRLRDRLTRHGLTLPAVLGPALFLAPHSVASPLLQTTRTLCREASVTPAVATWLDEAMRSLNVAKLKTRASTTTAIGLLGLCVGLGVWASRDERSAFQNTPSALEVSAYNPFAGDRPPTPKEQVLPPGIAIRLGTTQHRHVLARSVVFQPDGNAVLTFGDDGMLRSWEPRSGKLISEMELPGEREHSHSVSNDGMRVMRVRGDHIEFWRPGTRATMFSREFNDLKNAILSPDGRFLATVEGTPFGNDLNLYSIEPFVKRTVGKLKSFPGDLVIAPDGQSVYTSVALDGMIQCWDGQQEGPAWTARNVATRITISDDGKWLMVNPEQRKRRFQILDAVTGKPMNIPPLPVAGDFWGMALSPDGKRFACAGDKGVLVWNLREGMADYQIPGEAHAVQFSPDGRTLAALSGGIHLYEVASGKPAFAAAIDDGHTTPVLGIAWSPDSKRILSHAMQGRNDVLLWDVATSRPRPIAESMRTVAHAAFSRDGAKVNLLTFDGHAHLIDVASAKVVNHRSLVAAPEGRAFDATLARGGRRAIFLFDRGEHEPVPHVAWVDPATGTALWEVALPERFGRKAMLTSDGRSIYNPRGDQFDPELQQALPSLEMPAGKMLDEKAVCSANGALIAIPLLTSTDAESAREGIGVWERVTGQLLRIFPSRKSKGNIDLSPDGGVIAIADFDRVILWEVTSGKELAQLDLPPRPKPIADEWSLDAIAFSPDGRKIATGHFDSTILIWNVPPRDWVRSNAGEAWEQLGLNAGRAMPAFEWMLANPMEALAKLRAELRPVVSIKCSEIRRLLEDVDANERTRRDAAEQALAQRAEGAVPCLNEAVKSDLSIAQRQAVTTLLRAHDSGVAPTGNRLRMLRSIALLEQMASKAAMDLLHELSTGDPSARSAREARAAYERIRG